MRLNRSKAGHSCDYEKSELVATISPKVSSRNFASLMPVKSSSEAVVPPRLRRPVRAIYPRPCYPDRFRDLASSSNTYIRSRFWAAQPEDRTTSDRGCNWGKFRHIYHWAHRPEVATPLAVLRDEPCEHRSSGPSPRCDAIPLHRD